MTNKVGLTVVTDHTGRAGAVTWWRLSGTVDHAALAAAWTRAGFDEAKLPAAPGNSAALRRALDTFRGPHTLIRTLPKSVYAVVTEAVQDGEDPVYEVQYKVWIDMDELEIRFDREVDTATVDTIFNAFCKTRQELHPVDISAWLVRAARELSSVGLRDTGGIYFVPEQNAAVWSRIAAVLGEVKQQVFELPALKTDSAVAAIMESVITDTTTAVAQLTDALNNTPGSRALRSKAAACEALAAKLRLYEDLLGTKLTAMHESVAAVDVRITDMLLAEDAA